MQFGSLFLWDMATHHWVIGVHCYQMAWWSHFQGLKNLYFLTLEDETTTLSAKSDTTHPVLQCHIPQEYGSFPTYPKSADLFLCIALQDQCITPRLQGLIILAFEWQ
jgi:hypothetical protein